jgi:hypothetical protein
MGHWAQDTPAGQAAGQYQIQGYTSRATRLLFSSTCSTGLGMTTYLSACCLLVGAAHRRQRRSPVAVARLWGLVGTEGGNGAVAALQDEVCQEALARSSRQLGGHPSGCWIAALVALHRAANLHGHAAVRISRAVNRSTWQSTCTICTAQLPAISAVVLPG